MDKKILNGEGLQGLIALIKKQILDNIKTGSDLMTYVNPNQTTATVGGIAQGTDFADGVSIYSLLTAMLYPEEDPTLKLINELTAKIESLEERVIELEKDLVFDAYVEDNGKDVNTLTIESESGAAVQDERIVLDSKLVTVNGETMEIHKLGE